MTTITHSCRYCSSHQHFQKQFFFAELTHPKTPLQR